MTAGAGNPVHVGRILDHGPNWTWLQLDRGACALLRIGDIIRARPVSDDAPFRTGKCRVIGALGSFVHVARGARLDIIALADMDHVYLTERGDRRKPYAPLPAQPEPAFRLFEQDGELHLDTKHGPFRVTSGTVTPEQISRLREDRRRAIIGVDLGSEPSRHVVVTGRAPDGVFHIEPDPPDLAQLQAKLADKHREIETALQTAADTRAMFRGVDRSATPEKLSGAVIASLRRPDGFDQHQVDAARAALLAPAPPRYPRPR